MGHALIHHWHGPRHHVHLLRWLLAALAAMVVIAWP
jgi:hypothetical protein